MASETAGKTTSLLLKLYCGTGHIMNDVFRQIALSFVLIFMIKVAGLSGKEAGFILLLSQIVHGLVGPLMGYCSDKVVLPLIGRCLGRRKAWHLIGTILIYGNSYPIDVYSLLYLSLHIGTLGEGCLLCRHICFPERCISNYRYRSPLHNISCRQEPRGMRFYSYLKVGFISVERLGV